MPNRGVDKEQTHSCLEALARSAPHNHEPGPSSINMSVRVDKEGNKKLIKAFLNSCIHTLLSRWEA